MATPMPTPKHIMIWLDQHIGLLESNKQLKSSIGQQTDPESPFPIHPTQDVIDQLIQFQTNIKKNFNGIPNNLKAFDNIADCLLCIRESMNENKKIFFITSGSMGKDIAPDIIKTYSSLKTIYVFCGYYQAHLEWFGDCLEENINCIILNFHTDLLVRLLRDVAEYFISEGDCELSLNNQLAYSAILYFQWAKLLLERANNLDMKNIYIRLKYVNERISFTKQLREKLDGNNDDDIVSSEPC